MKVFETYQQYLADCTERNRNSHRPPSGPYLWRCDDCGKASPHTDSYALTNSRSMVCYGCANAREIEELKDRTKKLVCYLSCDGEHIATWTGGILGRVTSAWRTRSGCVGMMTRFHAVDSHGGHWYGTGQGNGMICTLQPMKGQETIVHN